MSGEIQMGHSSVLAAVGASGTCGELMSGVGASGTCGELTSGVVCACSILGVEAEMGFDILTELVAVGRGK